MNENAEFQKENPQTLQPKPMFQLKREDNVFALCTVILSIFTSVFGIFGGFSLGYLLSMVLMTVLFSVYFAKGGRVRAWPALCGLLALANSAVFICTGNGSVRFFGVIVSLLLLMICFDGLRNGGTKGNRQTLGVFYGAAATLDNIDVSVKSLFLGGNGSKKTAGKALVGFLCAVPVLLVVMPLLVASDDAFQGMMEKLFANTAAILVKTVFGVGLSVLAVSYGFSLKAGRTAKLKPGTFAGIENVYIISFLSAISACYLLYLFSQLAYFFSAFQGFLPDGELTYAQYARKGFFEMCVIAVINLVLVFLSLLLAKKQDGKVCRWIKLAATFIAVFTLIIIATAVSKMVLYIDAFGMTVLRVTTSAFMVFLSVVFVTVILRIYLAKINIVKVALVTAGCIVLTLGVVNVNAACAEYNYESYRLGKLDTVDVEALYNLGDEGIPYLVKLAEGNDETLSRAAEYYLAQAYVYDYFDNLEQREFTLSDLQKNQKETDFQYLSIPQARAYKCLYTFLEENPDFGKKCIDYTGDFLL